MLIFGSLSYQSIKAKAKFNVKRIIIKHSLETRNHTISRTWLQSVTMVTVMQPFTVTLATSIVYLRYLLLGCFMSKIFDTYYRMIVEQIC